MIKKILIKWFWNKKVRITRQVHDCREMKSVLFLKQNESREEILKNTALFREVKKRNPEIRIGVVLGKETEEILKNNPNIDNIYIYNEDKMRDIKSLAEEIKRAGYDIVIEERDLVDTLAKLRLESETADLTCDIHIADHYSYRAQAFKSFLKDKKMIVVYGSKIQEELLEKIKKLLATEDYSVTFLFPEENRKAIEEKIREIPGDIKLPMAEGIQDILALISIADEIITSDLLIKEIADAGRKKCLER